MEEVLLSLSIPSGGTLLPLLAQHPRPRTFFPLPHHHHYRSPNPPLAPLPPPPIPPIPNSPQPPLPSIKIHQSTKANHAHDITLAHTYPHPDPHGLRSIHNPHGQHEMRTPAEQKVQYRSLELVPARMGLESGLGREGFGQGGFSRLSS